VTLAPNTLPSMGSMFICPLALRWVVGHEALIWNYPELGPNQSQSDSICLG